MDRALPLTVRVAAVEAAVGLHLHLPFLKGVVDLNELVASPFDTSFMRINSLHFNKLVKILTHSISPQ
jgi:hypothetical protein